MPDLLRELHGRVLVLTLNRPNVMNALNRLLCAELLDAIDQAAGDASVGAIVLTGGGRGFCAGEDFSSFEEGMSHHGEVSYGDEVRRRHNPLILTLDRCPKPTIAALNGPVVGAGCGLALACDLRIAGEHASFAASFTRIGLIPDSGVSYLLTRIAGSAAARWLALTGEQISAEEAHRLGIYHRVVPTERLAETALAVAGQLADGPREALSMTKEVLIRAERESLEAMLEIEASLQNIAGRTADHQEAVRAFREKRLPRFGEQ